MYVVYFSWDYEGGKIKGIFRNKKEAEECLQRIKEARRGDDQFMTQIELDKELLREQEISI